MNEQQVPQANLTTVISTFLQRTDLKGGEVEAYAQAYNWIQDIEAGKLVVVPKEFLEDQEKAQAELTELREYKQQVENQIIDQKLEALGHDEEPEDAEFTEEVPLDDPVDEAIEAAVEAELDPVE